MLVAMTYNVYMFLSVVFGLGCGYGVFGFVRIKQTFKRDIRTQSLQKISEPTPGTSRDNTESCEHLLISSTSDSIQACIT